MSKEKNVRQVKRLLLLFMTLLVLSGLTAVPVNVELSFLLTVFPGDTELHFWLIKVLHAYQEVGATYPFLLYGYDWLAFAHLIIALFFIGPYRDPLRNIWVIEIGMIACLLVFPLALIAGSLRGIPSGWRLIDCSFGVFGFLNLWVCHVKAKRLSQTKSLNKQQYGNSCTEFMEQG